MAVRTVSPPRPFVRVLVEFLQDQADFILNTLSPIIWCFLFVLIMDRKSFIETWYMPILGVAAAFLANSVPIGGGIVYIPVLSLLGANITLGASFTIATMPFGNGVFGFLRWLNKDSAAIIWQSFPYTVIPSWLGSIMAMYAFDKPEIYSIKLWFGLFCFVLGILVSLALYRGGLRNVIGMEIAVEDESTKKHTNGHSKQHTTQAAEPPSLIPDLFSEENGIIESNSVQEEEEEEKVMVEATCLPVDLNHPVIHDWSVVALISFFGGFILVPNIGIGPALITYFILVILGFNEQAAIVTGIVTGGWVCIVPLIIHIYQLNDVPYKLWIMVLPGVFFGAKVSNLIICSLHD
jgi:uncharacterized membrane protein YfcA